MNNVIYGCYENYPYKKPTIFLSNINLNLINNCNNVFVSFEKTSVGINRSLIPQKLIIDIFKNFEKEDKNV